MERERAQYLALAIGNALFAVAGAVVAVGVVVLWRLAVQIDDRFGFTGEGGEPGFDEYLFGLWPYALSIAGTVGIIGGLGLVFRWLDVEQDAKMAEFEMLLDALGAPFEEDEEAAPEGSTRDA